jgi:aspartyl-tRNA(Asn)/glutamyl-tRNA(Gln) amidotransferase subunit C
MSSSIDEQQVRHVAHLSRLKLSGEETARFSRELSVILEYVDQLNRLDTGHVEPMAHPLPIRNAVRADQVEPSIPVEDALSNAPQREGSFFRVPKVLDQENA